jgi:CMP-N,N'-diacetyllegionaminic acid synthase
VFVFNGAIYIINIKSLLASPLAAFKKIVKFPMTGLASVDIDTMLDWHWAEYLIEKGLVKPTHAEH